MGLRDLKRDLKLLLPTPGLNFKQACSSSLPPVLLLTSQPTIELTSNPMPCSSSASPLPAMQRLPAYFPQMHAMSVYRP